MTAFEEMGVMPEIGQAVEEMDWSLPTDVQSEAIPMILGGGDVLMAAETGSGKTGAFCLPIIQIVYETMRDIKEGKGMKGGGGKSMSSKTWKMNVYDRGDAMAIDGNGLLCQSRDQQGWHGARSSKGVGGSGKYYYEAKITDEGLCRVGYSTAKAKLDLGTDKEGYGFGGTGKKSFGRQFDSYGETFGLNDVIGCYLDLDDYTVKWSKNGVDFGKAYDIPPNLRNSTFFAAVGLKNAEIEFNFGDSSFKYPPQRPYRALSQANAENKFDSPYSGGGVAAQSTSTKNAPFAIIIEPSRELADQTCQQIQKFKKHLKDFNVRDLLVVGGESSKDQVNALNNGVEIVCATPGRLEDLISTGVLGLNNVRFFVLDECDGLLSAGYGDMINRLHNRIPKVTNDGKRLQMVVCSATLHSFDVKKMAERLMYFPVWIDLKGQDSVPETVHHCVCMVDPTLDTSWKTLRQHIATDGVHEKDGLDASSYTPETLSEAVKMLKGEYLLSAIKKHKMDKALLFCRTKIDCDNVERYFISMGGGPNGKNRDLTCVCLHGDRRPQERKANLQKFKDGQVRFLICTDVAARGIDVSGLPYVVNVTLPDEKQNYVHRIGRVGRADRMGLAISLVSTKKEKVWYHSNCNNRGKGCYNTNLTTKGGCCIWYDEPKLLGEVEEHLGVTIDQVASDFNIPIDEFDGKVTYGQKKRDTGSGYKGHVEFLAPTVAELATLEKRAQSSFINLRYKKPFQKR